MTPLLALLLDRPHRGAWRIDHFDAVRQLLVESFGHRVVVIDLEPAADKAALLERVARALHLPDWFGHNWDALHDALGDLGVGDSHRSPSETVDLIVLRVLPTSGAGPQSVAAASESRDLETLIDIFAESARAAGPCLLTTAGGVEIPDLATRRS